MSRITILTLLLFSLHTHAQSQQLKGSVKSKNGTVVSNIWVSILGGDHVLTDNNGSFILSTNGCNCSIGKEITLLVFNDIYGFHRIPKTINQDYTMLLEIERKPNIVGIPGTIRDSKTRKLLKGINLKILSKIVGSRIPAVETDEYGTFIFYLKKDIIGTEQYLEFILTDPNDKYQDKQVVLPIGSPIEVFMTENANVHDQIEVARFLTTPIKVSPGDEVHIKASGSIKVGSWVGNSLPKGRTSGLLSADISAYNIVPKFNHAALLYRISGDSQWQFAGEDIEFIAQRDGYLEFEVNDIDKSNNSGAYQVRVIVK